MAYQQISTPRFYCNILEFNGTASSLFQTLPVVPQEVTVNSTPFSVQGMTEYGFVAVLGHNIAKQGNDGHFEIFENSGTTGIAFEDVVNGGYDGSHGPVPYDGFSICTFTGSDAIDTFYLTNISPVPNIGSIVVGTYYDMPHSADLRLSLSYDYSGVKEITTRGGASLSNSFWSKPPMWGENLAAWELSRQSDEDNELRPNQNLSRSGRKIWDLSFSFLSQSDTFPAIDKLLNLHSSGSYWHPDFDPATESSYDDEDLSGVGYTENLLGHDNFYSQVIHKTRGQLAFIFQPNKDDNTNFAICKFDQKSFSLQQTAPNLYSIKCRIRETF